MILVLIEDRPPCPLRVQRLHLGQISWLGFLDDSEYFRPIMIGQTRRQCAGKLSNDQTLSPVLSGVPFNPRDSKYLSILAGKKFVFWKAEFIRETVWELGELTGDW